MRLVPITGVHRAVFVAHGIMALSTKRKAVYHPMLLHDVSAMDIASVKLVTRRRKMLLCLSQLYPSPELQ